MQDTKKNDLFSTETLKASEIGDCVDRAILRMNKHETICPDAGTSYLCSHCSLSHSQTNEMTSSK